jgi:hypothetical protein
MKRLLGCGLVCFIFGCVDTISTGIDAAKKIKEANDARIAAQEALKKEQKAFHRIYNED